ncbi:hypothetical protein BT63DRAFT_368620, partial [Microthyrium microscopicum]
MLFSALVFLVLSTLISCDGNDRGRGWQGDPLSSFCRRFGHSTSVVDHKLYINGGIVNYSPQSNGMLTITDRYLLYNDLTTMNSANGMPQLYSNLTKNRTDLSVTGGALWGDSVNKFLYQFGGESSGKDLVTAADGLSIYDLVLNRWNHTKAPWSIRQTSWGASAVAEERGEGYYLGGWINNGTNPGFVGQQATPGLIRFDFNTGKMTNTSGPDMNARAEGVLVFIPASDNGMLIHFGGIIDQFRNGTMVGSPMNTIWVYDLITSKWISQNASGDIPDMRRRFCAGATWANDHSSYNIYLYGGLGIPPNGAGFDDVYILSLPSFTWVKWWSNSPSNPRHSMSCNVINRTQMIVIGGQLPDADPTSCDLPNIWGTRNLNLGKNGPGDSVWDLYYPNLTEYHVPSEVIAKIGGGPSGGATLQKPLNWDNRDLGAYFSRIPHFASRTATRVIPSATGT